MKEKRSHERPITGGTARLWEEHASDTATDCELYNFSYGGFSVFAPRGFVVGERIRFELTIPCLLRPLKGIADVRHAQEAIRFASKTYRVGCHFLDVDMTLVLVVINNHDVRTSNPRTQKETQQHKFDLPI